MGRWRLFLKMAFAVSAVVLFCLAECNEAFAAGYIGRTFAVFDFLPDSTAENDPDLDYLAVWLGLAISNGLQKNETVTVVERKKLVAILEELSLGSSDIVSAGTRLNLGRLTGADYLVFGSYVKAGSQIMLSARLVNSRSGVIIKSNNVFGPGKEIDKLALSLSEKLLKDAGIAAEREESRQTGRKTDLSRIGAYYLKGLELEKRHDYEGAVEAYKKVLKIDRDNPWVRKRIKRILVQ